MVYQSSISHAVEVLSQPNAMRRPTGVRSGEPRQFCCFRVGETNNAAKVKFKKKIFFWIFFLSLFLRHATQLLVPLEAALPTQTEQTRNPLRKKKFFFKANPRRKKQKNTIVCPMVYSNGGNYNPCSTRVSPATSRTPPHVHRYRVSLNSCLINPSCLSEKRRKKENV
jgi:hypothetical protein